MRMTITYRATAQPLDAHKHYTHWRKGYGKELLKRGRKWFSAIIRLGGAPL
ncbi:hypothetical protein PAE0471 [Pyrobaculum aerophilum str. IM2]|uniref:Uncharacterized protein n=1 Tax=Pyrobaculum aerophilum (strain ATCC 51768 / DSM 7523 / JCM 9630 / CIP 104966 / NBRC 100827 / IM2) TaxID=178306 RepID=Q8ZZ28_PYRAE|nr:hypothetical protein PAE0471 [Pyrobaculum aerophilum str. IM2]